MLRGKNPSVNKFIVLISRGIYQYPPGKSVFFQLKLKLEIIKISRFVYIRCEGVQKKTERDEYSWISMGCFVIIKKYKCNQWLRILSIDRKSVV